MHLKAQPDDILGRFREIVSDPLNLLIERHPLAGTVEDNLVYLHNGHKVPVDGPHAYYENFSEILVINRGVHEPLEEYVFQELLKVLPTAPVMLELGAYWGHYSMWLKKMRPEASVYMVEPEKENIEAGINNFKQHGYTGEFFQAFVGKNHFKVDVHMKNKGLSRLTVLHSDIQGYEVEMLEGSSLTLQQKSVDYLFVSTHSQQLHNEVSETLESFGYRVEVSSDYDSETTSFDGFIFASSPQVAAVFNNFNTPGRVKIIDSRPAELVHGLSNILGLQNPGGDAIHEKVLP